MKLDKYLETIPDKPRMDEQTPGAYEAAPPTPYWTRPRGWPGRGGRGLSCLFVCRQTAISVDFVAASQWQICL